jgi:Uma2 family endonuclease
MNGAMLVIEERPCLTVPADVFGLEGFLRWVHSPDFPDDRRASFLSGEVSIEMSAEEIVTHNLLKSAANRDLGMWVLRHDLGHLFADRALLVNDVAGLSTEPDLMLCLWATLRTGRAGLGEIVEGSGRFVEVRGSPDMVVEIVSDSSVRKDTIVLPELYFAAGVEEYWLIDARHAKIDFSLLVRGRKRFTLVKPDPQGYRRSRVLGGAFRLTRKKDPVGGSQYRLLSKQ